MHASTWMNPENMLSERIESQEAAYYMIPLILKCLEHANLYRQKVD